MSAVATTSEEHPVFIPSGGEELFGIVTEPVGEPKQVALVLLSGGGPLGAMGRNRIQVRIARRAAALGYHALRLDYHGVGESTGEIESFEADRPFVDDLLAGVRCLEERGIREIALAGWCFGARTALATADRIPGLRGVALFGPPVRDASTTSHYLRRAFSVDALREVFDASGRRRIRRAHYLRRAFSVDALREVFDASGRRRIRRAARIKMRAALRSSRLLPGATRPGADGVSPLFSDPLAKLAARGTPVLLGHGTGDMPYGVFREARPALSGVLEAPGARIEERLIPGMAYGVGETRLAVQETVASMLEDWLLRLDGVAGREA